MTAAPPTSPVVRDPSPPVVVPGLTLPALHDKLVREGTCRFREVAITVNIDHAFRDAWKRYQRAWLERGFSIIQVNGQWRLRQWLLVTPDGLTLTDIGKSTLARLGSPVQQTLNLTEPARVLELSPLPNGLESKLRAYQITPARQLYRALMKGRQEWGYPGAVDFSDMGCHAIGQLILMADGTQKPVEKIVAGDSVMGWRGPQTVTALKRGHSGMAMIRPIKGEPWVVNREHILTLQYGKLKRPCDAHKSEMFIDITVEDYLSLLPTEQENLKLARCEADWPATEQVIDPYFLGVLIGDGCFRGHSPSVSKPGDVIRSLCYEQAALWGGRISTAERSPNNPTYYFRGCDRLTNELKNLQLWGLLSLDKFVPHYYKACSKEQRLALLAGLLDTDGSLSSGGFDFLSGSWQLAEDVAFLCRSVGLAAYVKSCQKSCQNNFTGDYWRVSISGDCSIIPTRIKKASPRKQPKSVLRTGFTVELLPDDDFYGFSLSGDGRFLLGDFTVTHNTGKTYSTLAAALATGREVGVLCPSVGQQGWMRAFAHYGVEPLFISTYEAVRGAWRPHIATVDGQGKFTWAHPQDMVLILDEAQAVRHDGNLTVRCCSAAIRQGIPIIVASATIAVSPLEFRFAGRITGLHRGDDDWPRFLREHGCIETSRGNWKWDRKSHHLHRIHSRLFPFRGCRVRKQDLGEECPETVIEIIPFDMPECARIAQEWNDTNELLGRMAHQLDKRALMAMERKCRMKMWKRCENVLVPHVAKRVRADVADGKSVAVFMNFTECRMELSRLVGTRAGFYGGQNKHQRKHWEKEFQENREHILVSNIGAGGASVSLHDIHGERPRVSYIFPTDDVVKFYQATGRVDRVGGKSVSQQFLPCVKGAMTEEIVHRLRRKMMRIDILNDGARAGEARF